MEIKTDKVKVGNPNANTKTPIDGNNNSLTKNNIIQKQAAYHPVGQCLRDKIKVLNSRMITKFIQQCKPQQRNRTHNNEKIEGVLLSND